MRISSLLPTLGAFFAETQVLENVGGGNNPIDAFIKTQYPIAKTGILDNIGSKGRYAHDAKPGVLVTSPSTTPPSYKLT